MFLIKIYIKESYINYYHTIIQMCGQYCILAPGILQHDVSLTGPCIKGSRSFPCGQKMMLKKTNDSKDEVIWRCRKKHKVSSGQLTSVTKDVKLSIRHQSWLVDTKVPLPIVYELMYLWSQGFSIDEIIHELKI